MADGDPIEQLPPSPAVAPGEAVPSRERLATLRRSLARSRVRKNEAIDRLEREAVPGDILLVSQGGPRQRLAHRVLQGAAQAVQQIPGMPYVHALHAMVVDSSRSVRHITMEGRQGGSISATFRGRQPYNTVTLVRIGNAASRARFTREAERVAAKERTYNSLGLLQTGIQQVRRRVSSLLGTAAKEPKIRTATAGSCICLDYVTEAAEAAGLPSLASAHTPADVAFSAEAAPLWTVTWR